MLDMSNSFQVERTRMTQWFDARVRKAEKEVVTEVVTMTPVLASLLMERNEANRTLSEAVTWVYARDMAAGRWQMNGEPVIVSREGKLNDGQHRCAAVILCEAAVPMVLVFGVGRETRFTVDQGRARTAGDYVGMHGHVDANVTAAVAASIWMWKERGKLSGGGRERPTKSEVLLVVEHYHAQILDSIRAASRPGVSVVGGRSLVAFSHWAFRRRTNEADATAFVEKLIDGAELTTRDPIMLARRRFLSGVRMSPNEKVELIFRAWNAHRAGETPHRLTVLDGPLPKLER